MNWKNPWAAFLLLGCIWGSSFLFVRIALDDLGPFTLVSARMIVVLLFLTPLVYLRRAEFPLDSSAWAGLLFQGAVGIAVPFTLISWGQQRIDSGLASILVGATPLFSILLGDLWLRDSPVAAGKVLGVIGGFLGIVVLMGDGQVAGGALAGSSGRWAVLAAAACYAVSNVFVRKRLSRLKPLMLAYGQSLVAGILVWGGAWLIEKPPVFSTDGLMGLLTGRSLFAVIWLGVLGSGIAYLLHFYLVQTWGATRASLVTYVIPVIGFVLGVVVLDEPVTWRLFLGGILVVGGVILVNLRRCKSRPSD